MAFRIAEVLERYLTGYAAFDRFGGDHDSRRNWKISMQNLGSQKFAELFNKLYLDQNQLRINRISAVRTAAELLMRKSFGFGEDIVKQASDLDKFLINDAESGKYFGLTNEQKTRVVKGINDRIVPVLNALFSGSGELIEAKVT